MYEQETSGVVVRAEPAFLPHESDPEDGRFVWAYSIEIENRTREAVQLVSRHWRITDTLGVTQEVRGQGVVGKTPVIQPGESFRYSSAAPLHAASGLMVGSYEMVRLDSGDRFTVAIPAFALDSPYAVRLAN